MIKSEPYYWVECDRCGVRAEYGDFSAMSDASNAVEIAEMSEWLTVNGIDGVTEAELHYCDGCVEWSDDEDQMVPKAKEEK